MPPQPWKPQLCQNCEFRSFGDNSCRIFFQHGKPIHRILDNIVKVILYFADCLFRLSDKGFTLSELNFRMRPILISINLRMSSRVTSRINDGLKGIRRISIWLQPVHVFRILKFPCPCKSALRWRFSPAMQKQSPSSCSAFSISSSVRSRWRCRLPSGAGLHLHTYRKWGLLSLITQQLGDMLISQSVNAYSASIVLSEDTPGARWTRISTLRAVLSSTFLILYFPLVVCLLRMDSNNGRGCFSRGFRW